MARKTYKPDLTDPKYKILLDEIEGLLEVGECLAVMGYKGKVLESLRQEIAANCEVISVNDNYLIDVHVFMNYLRSLEKKTG